MKPFFTIFAITAAASVAVSANPIVVRDPIVTFSIARRFNSTGTANIVKADQARAKVLKARSQADKVASIDTAASKIFSGINVPVTNQATFYTASVGVGTPPTSYELIVDTGSSNTWVGAGKAYVETSSSVDTGAAVAVSYGSGFFFGEEYTDTITVGHLVVKRQSIGVAVFASGFNGVDGILGLGPVDLTDNTTSTGGEIPTVVDSAFAEGLIHAKVVGVSFEPSTKASVTNGELTFGGVDYTKVAGPIKYVPITSTSPASDYVGIDQSITYGSSRTLILSATAGITDTGTTLVLIASGSSILLAHFTRVNPKLKTLPDAFAAYQKATGGVLDGNTGLLKITVDQFAKLESLFFHIGGTTYEFTPNAQIWPRALNAAIGGDADGIYLVTADLGSPSGEGFDFIDGYAFLERFYYVYDSSNSCVGLAKTNFTYAKIN
ncbi:transporter [Ganoderma sinense ZZ0214-1]|uniref:Transporter n=1 Tax=Ganoderma sinense ZZ0214-1 TaxID=1077348 RepID=A0A2G8S4N7_9APHY|nr:transporter [Ganoderma sinense ZZ0214-1]